MRKVLIATITLLTITLGIYAQRSPGMGRGPMAGIQEYMDMDPEKNAEKTTKRLSQELDLSEEQGTQVQDLYVGQYTKVQVIAVSYEPTIAAMREEAQAARDVHTGDPESMRAAMQEIRSKYREDLSGMRTKIQEVNAGTDEALKEILDESQYQSYLALKEERKEKRQGRGRSGGRERRNSN